MKVFNKNMTGMKVSWGISSNRPISTGITEPIQQMKFNNRDFKDFVHAVGNFSGTESLLWEIIKEIKRDFTRDDTKCKPNITLMMKNIKQNLTSKHSVTTNDLTADLLNMAGKMFIYIKTNPREEWIKVLINIKTMFEKEKSLSPKAMLLLLSYLKPQQGHIGENIQKILFETLSNIDNLAFDKVDNLTSLEDIGPDLTTEVKG